MKSFIYKIKSKYSASDVIIMMENVLKKMQVSYEEIGFNFADYEQKGKQNRGLRYLQNRKEYLEYQRISAYDKSGTRRIAYCSQNQKGISMEQMLEITDHIGKSVFKDILFQKKGANDLEMVNLPVLKFTKTYNGEFIEVYFEAGYNEEQRLKMLETLNSMFQLKFIQCKNIILVTKDEERIFYEMDKKIERVFMEFDGTSQVFKFSRQEDTDVNFGRIIKQSLKQNNFMYGGYDAGAYEIYTYTDRRECLKILFDFDNERRQLSSTLQYKTIYKSYPYALSLPLLNQYICKQNVMDYIVQCVNVAQKLKKCLDENLRDEKVLVEEDIDLRDPLLIGKDDEIFFL